MLFASNMKNSANVNKADQVASASQLASMRYSPGLDGLRAIAALIIVFYHAKVPSLSGGFFGVDIFFVLSGYLITRLLVAEHEQAGRIDYRAFMVRRLRRLAPALWVFLLVYMLVAPLIFIETPWQKHAQDAGWSAIYLVNYAASLSAGVAVLGQVWSLAVEMQFYLLWPLLLVVLLRFRHRGVICSLILLYMLATAWRWWAAENFPNLWDFYVRADTRASGLLLGCLLGYLNCRINARWAWPAFLLLAFSMTFYSTHWLPTARYGFTLAEIGAALLILAQPAWLGSRLLVWIGNLSYGLYLWHYLFMRILREWGWEWPETLLVGGGLGLLAAMISYRFVERRFYRRSAKSRTEVQEMQFRTRTN
ncbi:acyltransferase family protein [Isoalcanivorax pacificus]|uniref:acyltransferase family protein n=1 Tax=Isoalcanivorax pacificus TaxID=1306787 RepID=UPI00193114F6|nr:acyltransferase [Isoalcanivorax pacificus]